MALDTTDIDYTIRLLISNIWSPMRVEFDNHSCNRLVRLLILRHEGKVEFPTQVNW